MLNNHKNDIQNLIKITKNIDGWLSTQEGIFLFKLAGNLPEKSNIVEIGSYKGKSAIWLASGILDKEKAKVYAVDPHVGSPEKKDEYGKIDTFQEFQKNIGHADLENKVIPIKKASRIASASFDKDINLLFIDASHTYKAAKNDFLCWAPKVVPNGWIVMHDATVLPGPWKVARRHILFSTQFVRTGMLGSMVFGQYKPSDKIYDKLTSLFKNLFSYLFIISYVTMRKISFPSQLKKLAKKINFVRAIKLTS